jgi:RNA polymerase sigma-70 factor (ECF subfamily)
VTGAEEFRVFYDAAFGRLVGQLFLITGDQHEAEEVVQEAFARAAARWSRLQDYDAPEAWVRRVAMNLAASRARQARRRLAILARLRPAAQVPPASDEALALAEALRTLPMRQRRAIVLHHLIGMPVQQVATTMGVPAGTVKTWLGRGRRALAVRLGDPEEVWTRHD